jgi:pimeloyl-[acyl-carrier protein] methyl ester esterase
MSELSSFMLRTCRLSSGLQMSWRETGSGTPLVMLHGWSMSSAVFGEVAALLSNKHRVLCPDLPGHGGSSPLAEFSLHAMAEQLRCWMIQLAIPPAALLGWSLGGQLALEMALEFPDQVQSLLLVSTTPRFCQSPDWPHGLPPTQLRLLERNLERAYEKTLGDFFQLQFEQESVSRERFREILQFAVRTSPQPELKTARETLAVLGATDLRSCLAAVRQPTQIFHGQIDRIIPLGAGRFMAEQIPGADLCELIGIGHAPFLSVPQQLASQWELFLQ